MNSPNASITFPAASGPVCPSFRTIRVDATFNPRRSTVAISKRFGKEEKSSGRCVCSATIKMSKDSVILTTKNVSRSATGRGSTSIATSAIIPNGIKVFTNFGVSAGSPKDCNLSIILPFQDVSLLTN